MGEPSGRELLRRGPACTKWARTHTQSEWASSLDENPYEERPPQQNGRELLRTASGRAVWTRTPTYCQGDPPPEENGREPLRRANSRELLRRETAGTEWMSTSLAERVGEQPGRERGPAFNRVGENPYAQIVGEQLGRESLRREAACTEWMRTPTHSAVGERTALT